MKVTNLETSEMGGIELLKAELLRVWKDDPKVIEAVLERKPYEQHSEFTSLSGHHSKGVYVMPEENGTSIQVHWGFRPSGSSNSYGGCDLDLIVA